MKIKGLGHKQQRSMFPQKSPFYPPFRAILPPFCHPFGFDSARGQPLSGTQGKGVATFALVTMVGPNRVLPDQPRVNLAALRTVKLLPAFFTRLIDKSCAIRMSDGQVSSCQRAYTRAPPFGVGDTRACFSYRIAKDGRHDPDIDSLRQDRRNLASVFGRVKWRRAWNPAFGAVSAPRSRPGSPGGARPDARRLPATGHGWRRRNGPATGRRPASATAPASSRRYSPTARKPRPAHRRSRLCPRGTTARCTPPGAGNCPARILRASLRVTNPAVFDPRPDRATAPLPDPPPQSSPRRCLFGRPAGPRLVPVP